MTKGITMAKKQNKQNYIDEQELFDLLTQWKKDKVHGNRMSERLCTLFMLICDGVLKKPTYIRIPNDIKEEIKSNAMLNLILYIHNFKVENAKSKTAAFTYVTFSIETSYKGSLKKINEKAERLPLLFDSDIIEDIDIADLN